MPTRVSTIGKFCVRRTLSRGLQLLALGVPWLHVAAQPLPLISPVSEQYRAPGVYPEFRIAVASPRLPAPYLAVTGYSSNQVLLPDSDIRIEPAWGKNVMWRTVTILGSSTDFASTTATLVVSDGNHTAQTSFRVYWVLSHHGRPIGKREYIEIRDRDRAFPYPSEIKAGGRGVISELVAGIVGLSHLYPDDIGILLASSHGPKVVLMRGAGGAGDAWGLNLMFDDEGREPIPDKPTLLSGTWRPADYDTNTTNFRSPAPPGPYEKTLKAFRGTPADATWSLYVEDYFLGDTGAITNGWSVETAVQPDLFGLHDVMVMQGNTVTQDFFVGNTTWHDTNFVRMSSDQAAVPIESIQVLPRDGTGTNYSVRFTALNPATNVTVALFTTNHEHFALSDSLQVTVTPRPKLEWYLTGRLVVLEFEVPEQTDFLLYESTNLVDWVQVPGKVGPSRVFSYVRAVNPMDRAVFYKVARTR